MSQKIVTLCDEHGASGDEVPGAPVEVRITGHGLDVAVLVDLCDVDTKPLRDLAEHLAEIGRPLDDGARARTSARTSITTCPHCGSQHATRNALGHHVRRHHGTGLVVTPGASAAEMVAALTCPECGLVTKAPQGLGVHRARIHGVKGTSSSQRQREAREAREREARGEAPEDG